METLSEKIEECNKFGWAEWYDKYVTYRLYWDENDGWHRQYLKGSNRRFGDLIWQSDNSLSDFEVDAIFIKMETD
jgi:hypothetical protein